MTKQSSIKIILPERLEKGEHGSVKTELSDIQKI